MGQSHQAGHLQDQGWVFILVDRGPLGLLPPLWERVQPAQLCEEPRLGNNPQTPESILQKLTPKYAHELPGSVREVSLLFLVSGKLRTRDCRDFCRDPLLLSHSHGRQSQKKTSAKVKDILTKSSSVMFLDKWPSPQRGRRLSSIQTPGEGWVLRGNTCWVRELPPVFSSQRSNSNLERDWDSRQNSPEQWIAFIFFTVYSWCDSPPWMLENQRQSNQRPGAVVWFFLLSGMYTQAPVWTSVPTDPCWIPPRTQNIPKGPCK